MSNDPDLAANTETGASPAEGGIPTGFDFKRIAKLRGLSASATPGPWEFFEPEQWDNQETEGGAFGIEAVVPVTSAAPRGRESIYLYSDSPAIEPIDLADDDLKLIAQMRTELPDLLSAYEDAMNELQAWESHCQSLGKELSRTRQKLAKVDADKADQATYLAGYYKRETVSKALREALCTPDLLKWWKTSGMDVTVGDGSWLNASIRASHSKSHGDLAYVSYVLNAGAGYYLDADSSDDTDSAREHLSECHRISQAIINHPFVRPLLLNAQGELVIGPPAGNLILHPKPGSKPRKSEPPPIAL